MCFCCRQGGAGEGEEGAQVGEGMERTVQVWTHSCPSLGTPTRTPPWGQATSKGPG